MSDAPKIQVQTRWRDVYANDLVLDRERELWRVESIDSAQSQLRVTLIQGGRQVSACVDIDDTVGVLVDDPAHPKAQPRISECRNCHGRGKVHRDAA